MDSKKPLFIRFVSDVSPASSDPLLGSSRSTEVIEYLIIKTEFLNWNSTVKQSPHSRINPKMLYVIKDKVRELNQWCCDIDLLNPESSEINKMLFVIKDGVRELEQWCNKLLKYGEAVSCVKQNDSPKAEDELVQEEQQKDCKEGVMVDRVGDCYSKLFVKW